MASWYDFIAELKVWKRGHEIAVHKPLLLLLMGKCQYIPNSFVPVHPEQQKGYNTCKVIPEEGIP